jgi:ribonuclease Z
MPHLHLLGTGAALSTADRTTTMLAFEGESVLVVDCGGDVVHRMLKAGLDLDRIAALVLTHEHPDHVGGFPLFMEKIWLSERRRPIPVCGPASALDVAKRLFGTFDTSGWKGLPEIEWREVPLEQDASVWEDEHWKVTAAPGEHSVPVIGLRVEDLRGGGVVTYSADTERAESIERLARGADILVHEATGEMKGHATPREAAEVARGADVRRLVLIHIPPDLAEDELSQARDVFAATEIGEDGAKFDF